MRKIINFGLLALLILVSRCSTEIVLEEYIDLSAPFNLTHMSNKIETGLTDRNSEILEVNSEKWKKLIDWGNSHREGWKPSPASFIGDIYVSQGDFKLIHTRDSKGVVIAFTDKEGNPRQYTNVIKKGELNFLYK